MLIYIVPIIVFLVMSFGIYFLKKDTSKDTSSKDAEKKENNFVFIILPSLVVSILVYVFIKYKDHIFNSEPMMSGNFFDTPPLTV